MKSRIATLAIGAGLLYACLMLAGQEATSLFRTSAREVLLDVVVTGKSGEPVRGLAERDFTVSEDHAAQRITFFKPPDARPSDNSRAAKSADALEKAHTIILLDELNLSFENLAYARYSIGEFLKRQTSLDQLIALLIIGPRGLTPVQDFTIQSSLLLRRLAAIPAVLVNPAGSDVDAGIAAEHANSALAALEQIARAAVGYPYRLNVVWLTSGFRGVLPRANTDTDLVAGLRRLANLLLESRMNLYTIDPSGVLQESPVLNGHSLDETTNETVEQTNRRAAELTASAISYPQLTADLLLRQIAREMGGLSYFNRNDVDTALAQALRDGASSYTLAYYPANADFDGKYRKIEVQVRKTGTTARTRRGYYAAPEDMTSDPTRREALLKAALGSPLPYGGQTVTCSATYDRATKRLSGEVSVVPRAAISQAGEVREIVWMAGLSRADRLLSSRSWEINWKPSRAGERATSRFDERLQTGTSRLRVVVSDLAASRIGTCDYRVP